MKASLLIWAHLTPQLRGTMWPELDIERGASYFLWDWSFESLYLDPANKELGNPKSVSENTFMYNKSLEELIYVHNNSAR